MTVWVGDEQRHLWLSLPDHGNVSWAASLCVMLIILFFRTLVAAMAGMAGMLVQADAHLPLVELESDGSRY